MCLCATLAQLSPFGVSGLESSCAKLCLSNRMVEMYTGRFEINPVASCLSPGCKDLFSMLYNLRVDVTDVMQRDPLRGNQDVDTFVEIFAKYFPL